jgi:plastocyanin
MQSARTLVLLLAAAAAPAFAGDVEGTVKLSGPVPALAPLAVTKDRPTCGDAAPDESLVTAGGRLANVVVTAPGAPTARPVQVTLDQRGCRFVPHVLAAPVGSTLELANGDAVLHGTHGWAGHATRFDVVMPEKGMRVPTRLDRAGLIEVRCDVHGWMRAYVVVAEAPAAVSGADGAFVLRDLPAGTYTLAAWHERLGTRNVEVTVPAQGAVRVEVDFGG